MREYKKPILDIYEFDSEDEITASIVYEDNYGRYTDYITRSESGYQDNMLDEDTVMFDEEGLWQ